MGSRAEEIRIIFKMKMMEAEGTFLCERYSSALQNGEGLPAVSTIYGLYCREPRSFSRFHCLSRDEVWNFYEGDPLRLFLLYPDGSSEERVLGPDWRAGQQYQITIPAGVWQGGCLAEGGDYALYGCCVSPGFTPSCYRGGDPEMLLKQYPAQAEIIRLLHSEKM